MQNSHRRWTTPAAGNISGKSKYLTPAAAHPDITVAAMSPMTGNPDGMRMRTGRPAAGGPDPVAAPFPTARYPEPKGERSGSDRHDFNLRRRRIFRLLHHDLAAGRRSRLHHGHGSGRAFDNAPCQQGQAGGHGQTSYQPRGFHIHHVGRSHRRFCYRISLREAFFKPVPPAASAPAGCV